MELIIYLDADSLPLKHREIILKRCIKENIITFFVADRELKDVKEAIKQHTIMLRSPYRATLDYQEIRKIKSSIEMIVVEGGVNAADDRIVSLANKNNLCITHDIPLAARLIEKGVVVIDDRGNRLDKSNINERLSIRDTQMTLREMGIFNDKQKQFDLKTYNAFANAFDKAISEIKRL